MSSEPKMNRDGRYRFTGSDGIEQFLAMARKAFPDIKFSLEHRIEADGENVSYVWSATGTHTGDLEGFPATGQKATLIGITSTGKENLPQVPPPPEEQGPQIKG